MVHGGALSSGSGDVVRATALWCEGPLTYGLRQEALAPGPGDVVVAALASGISRGTERLVMRGEVPRSEHEAMRCPHQAGAFPFPVKYGYALVGRIVAGPADRLGRTVFGLHPHQTHAVLGAEQVVPVPDGVPEARACLAANMETALNIVWDSRAGPCDRVLVVGCGVVGLLVARLLARMPGTEVTACDTDPAKAPLADAMGAAFAICAASAAASSSSVRRSDC